MISNIAASDEFLYFRLCRTNLRDRPNNSIDVRLRMKMSNFCIWKFWGNNYLASGNGAIIGVTFVFEYLNHFEIDCVISWKSNESCRWWLTKLPRILFSLICFKFLLHSNFFFSFGEAEFVQEMWITDNFVAD